MDTETERVRSLHIFISSENFNSLTANVENMVSSE